MNILLINHYAGSPEMGMEFRPYYMAREWQNKGHNVLIVTASFAHTRKIQFDIEGKSKHIEKASVNYFILKTPIYSGNGFGRVKNMLAFVRACKKNAKYLASSFEPDVVIASSTYPLDNYSAKKICKYSNAKMVYEVHDLWPLSPLELGGYSKSHPFIIIMQRAENFAYKHSDAVVSMLPNAYDHMRDHGLAKDKFHYVPNGIVVDEWDPSKEIPKHISSIISSQKAKNHSIIGYAGSHGTANALNTLLDAMNEIKDEPVSVLLLGDGPEKNQLEQTAKNLNLENVFFVPPVNKNLIPAILNKLDILYIGLQDQPLFRFGISPNKLIDYMMAGKPIIQAINAGNDPVKEAKCGLSIEPENSIELAKAIRSLLHTSETELSNYGKNGTKFILDNHTYNILSEKFINILQSIN